MSDIRQKPENPLPAQDFNIRLQDPRRSPSKKSFLIETLDESSRMLEADDQSFLVKNLVLGLF